MRKLMWFTIGFMAACAFCAYLYPQWVLYAALGCAISAVLYAICARFADVLRCVCLLFLGLALGFGWFAVYDHLHLQELFHLDGTTREATIIVRDYSYASVYGTAVEGTVEIDGNRYEVLVFLDERVGLVPGNRIIGRFEFDTQRIGDAEQILKRGGRSGVLRAYQDGTCIIERFWSTPWRDLPTVWRYELRSLIDDAFPKDTAGFAKALLLGDRSDIDYQTSTAFKVSGISHVIAVSGLHVSILFGLLQLICGRRRVLTAVIGMPMILLFAAIVGFTPSVTRAAIMQILMMAAMLFDREYDPPTALSFAALVMVVTDPMVVLSVSAQLSFACMAGIYLLGEPLKKWMVTDRSWGRWNRLLTGVASSVAITVSSAVMTMPLVALYFGTVSLVSVLTNLMTLWVISFIFYGIMVVCAVGWISLPVASGVAWAIAWPIRFVLETAQVMSRLPMAALYTKSGYVVAWLVFVYVLLGAFLLMKRRPVAVFASAAVLSLCLCVSLSWAEPLCDGFRVTMLDVGQGQSILLQADGKNFLVDCGGRSDGVAADQAAETLLSQGVSHLDGIILTHFDHDHAGGVDELLTRIDADLVLMPYAADPNHVADRIKKIVGCGAICLAEDQRITAGGVELTVFAPESYNSGNESGLCVLFSAGKCDILITGDRSEAGERLLLMRHDLTQVDVLVAGHHGARNSTGQLLLERVRPKYVLISVAENNFYGHPHEELLRRLQDLGCVILCTDENGTIIFRG